MGYGFLKIIKMLNTNPESEAEEFNMFQNYQLNISFYQLYAKYNIAWFRICIYYNISIKYIVPTNPSTNRTKN